MGKAEPNSITYVFWNLSKIRVLLQTLSLRVKESTSLLWSSKMECAQRYYLIGMSEREVIIYCLIRMAMDERNTISDCYRVYSNCEIWKSML